MSKNSSPNSSDKRDGIKDLLRDLRESESSASAAELADLEVLPIIVDDAFKGIDIAKRHPAFYQKLIANKALREIFLDALDLAEKGQQGELVSLPETVAPNLNFLKEAPVPPTIMERGHDSWQVHWHQTIQQLQSVFFPRRLAYRSDPLFEDPWFDILHTEIEVGGVLYGVALECTPSKENDDAFSIFLVLNSYSAMTDQRNLTLQARLQWGQAYDEHIQVHENEQTRLPDILLANIFDTAEKQINAELSLTIQTHS